MKFKLDENLGRRGQQILGAEGHDVSTVTEQSLQQAEDQKLIAVCKSEGRCLVTLDLDFANPLVFVPSKYCGIAVLRLPTKPSANDLGDLIRTLAVALRSESIHGKLWIVENGRIRIYQEEQRD